MKSEIRLLSLKCTKCAQPLDAEMNTIVLYCSGCGSGLEIGLEQPSPVPVYFARHTKNAMTFRCFWAFNATLMNAKREAKGGFFKNPKGLMHLFEERKGLRFYVSTERSDLSAQDPVALQLTRAQPELEFLPYQKALPPVQMSQKDARDLADYLLITSEAKQGDTLRSLSYELELKDPMLIAIAGWGQPD
jgi:hypothetical protein